MDTKGTCIVTIALVSNHFHSVKSFFIFVCQITWFWWNVRHWTSGVNVHNENSNAQIITSLRLNLFSFFINCCDCTYQNHKRKTICLDIFLLSVRQWGTKHQYLLSRFLGVTILQLFIIYSIYDYLICWRCHSNGVNTRSCLPNISDIKTRKKRNMIRIDMIWNKCIV